MDGDNSEGITGNVVIIDIPNGEILNRQQSDTIVDDLNIRIQNAIEKEGINLPNNTDTNSLEQHLVGGFKKLRERVIIYEYLCYRTSIYYDRLNKLYLVPSILLSSVLTLINSNIDQDMNYGLKITNVVCNGTLTLLISLQNAFKLAEKKDYFFNMKKKFTKLHNSLNNSVVDQISCLRVDQEQMVEFMKEYDALDENISYEFPRHIIDFVRVAFDGYSMPTICNGIRILENEIQPRTPKRGKRYTIPAEGAFGAKDTE